MSKSTEGIDFLGLGTLHLERGKTLLEVLKDDLDKPDHPLEELKTWAPITEADLDGRAYLDELFHDLVTDKRRIKEAISRDLLDDNEAVAMFNLVAEMLLDLTRHRRPLYEEEIRRLEWRMALHVENAQ
jgi:hypothetical protein